MNDRHVTGEVAQEWQDLSDAEEDNKRREELLRLIDDVVPYLMSHNAEAEACDILMEVEKLEKLHDYVDDSVFVRVCLYLKRFVLSVRISKTFRE